MASGIQASSHLDLVKDTLKELNKGKYTFLANELQNYISAKKLMRKNRIDWRDGGYEIQWNLMLDHNNQARWTKLYKTETASVTDSMVQASVPWRHCSTVYAYDTRELPMNSGAARIVNWLEAERVKAKMAYIELMEDAFWSLPAASNDDQPYGVPYWIVKTSETSFGFHGQNPSGYSTVAGLDASATANARWRNGAAQYTNVSRTDLIKLWREAATKTRFIPPLDVPNTVGGHQYGYYTNYTVLSALETAVEDQNETLGNDLASKDGKVMFRQVPVTWVPKLEDDTQDPVYGINWDSFRPAFLKGEFMKESEPIIAPDQHRVLQVWLDTSMQYMCYDRRSNFVLSTA